MVLSFAGYAFAPPGYMVWCALIYAGAASFLSWRVGRPLINLNAERYAQEAEFRLALVRANEDIDGITLHRGASDERQRLDALFGNVLDISRRIAGAVTRLTWVTAGSGWVAIAAPILVAAPAYFQGTMSFGELMMIVGAFNQVQEALRWFVDNFSVIADWRATLLRVASFQKAIVGMDELGHDASRINFAEADAPSTKIDDLLVASPAGSLILSEPRTDLEAGERIPVVPSERARAVLAWRKEQSAAKEPGRLTYVVFPRRISRQRRGNQLSPAASLKSITPLSTPVAKLGENSSRRARESNLSVPGPGHTSVKTYDRWYYSSSRR